VPADDVSAGDPDISGWRLGPQGREPPRDGASERRNGQGHGDRAIGEAGEVAAGHDDAPLLEGECGESLLQRGA
jgi:hypothetical protein